MDIRIPFSISVETTLSGSNVESLIELSRDAALRDIVKGRPLTDFLVIFSSRVSGFSGTSDEISHAFHHDLQLRSRIFNTLVYPKDKYRNGLGIERDLRIKSTSFPENLELSRLKINSFILLLTYGSQPI